MKEKRGGKHRVTVEIPDAEFKPVMQLVRKQSKTLTAIVREALASYVETAKEKP